MNKAVFDIPEVLRNKWSDIMKTMHGPIPDTVQIAGIMDGNLGVTTEPDRLFTDKSGGFTFDRPMWKNMHVSDGRRYIEDARAHRDEAHRRKIVCRLESREKETAHWLAQQRFLENLYKLEPIE